MKISKLLRVSEESLKLKVLEFLIKQPYPVTYNEILEKIGIKERNYRLIETILDELAREGYDLKIIHSTGTKKVGLVRYGSYDSNHYYRIIGEIEFPVLITGDWHICSKGFSIIAFEKLLEDCKKFKIKTLLHTGDLIQGLGVYRIEAMDVLEPSIDAQTETAASLLNKIPRYVRKILVIGNHEEKLKGSWTVGHDPIKVITANVSNCEYYGHTAKFRFKNSKYTLLLMHGSGAPSYAWSYAFQKVLRNLSERPTFLVMGHFHQLGLWAHPPNNYVVASGTLQRENSYLLNRGIQAVVGWVILKKFDGHSLEAYLRTPSIF